MSERHAQGRMPAGAERTRFEIHGPRALYTASDETAAALKFSKGSFISGSIRLRKAVGQIQENKVIAAKGRTVKVGETIITPQLLHQFDNSPSIRRSLSLPRHEYESLEQIAADKRESISGYTNKSLALAVVLYTISAHEGLRESDNTELNIRIGGDPVTLLL